MDPRAERKEQRWRVQKPVSSFIPESFPKPLQPFHRISLDGGIKNAMFKWRFCNKAELHFADGGAESKQLGAGRSQKKKKLLFFPRLGHCFPSGKGTSTTDSLSLSKLFVSWILHFRCNFQGNRCVTTVRRAAKHRLSNWRGLSAKVRGS